MGSEKGQGGELAGLLLVDRQRLPVLLLDLGELPVKWFVTQCDFDISHFVRVETVRCRW
jgi:hypothetical protein